MSLEADDVSFLRDELDTGFLHGPVMRPAPRAAWLPQSHTVIVHIPPRAYVARQVSLRNGAPHLLSHPPCLWPDPGFEAVRFEVRGPQTPAELEQRRRLAYGPYRLP